MRRSDRWWFGNNTGYGSWKSGRWQLQDHFMTGYSITVRSLNLYWLRRVLILQVQFQAILPWKSLFSVQNLIIQNSPAIFVIFEVIMNEILSYNMGHQAFRHAFSVELILFLNVQAFMIYRIEYGSYYMWYRPDHSEINSISTDRACLNAWFTQVKTQFISVFPYQNYTVFSTKFKYGLTLWTLFIQSP